MCLATPHRPVRQAVAASWTESNKVGYTCGRRPACYQFLLPSFAAACACALVAYLSGPTGIQTAPAVGQSPLDSCLPDVLHMPGTTLVREPVTSIQTAPKHGQSPLRDSRTEVVHMPAAAAPTSQALIHPGSSTSPAAEGVVVLAGTCIVSNLLMKVRWAACHWLCWSSWIV